MVSHGIYSEIKLNFSFNAGLQRNNLDDQLLTVVRRAIYSTSVGYTVNDRLNISTNYANFSTNTRQIQMRRELFADSLEYFQVTRSGGANINYQLPGKVVSHNFFLNNNVQDATDSENNSSTFFNLTAGHQVKISKAWGLTTTYTMNPQQDHGYNQLDYRADHRSKSNAIGGKSTHNFLDQLTQCLSGRRYSKQDFQSEMD